MMAQEILVGTSGWHYPHWRGPFYPEQIASDRMLEFYAQRLATVEINNSFYRLPSRKTFRSWRQATPKQFLFAVKASRYITHMKKLKDPKPSLQRFLSCATGLGPKFGPILFQLPPRWRRDSGRLEDFLQALPRKRRCAFEFRDPSWLHPEIYRLLERHNAAFCVFDLAGEQSPRLLTANFGYVRLHGPTAWKYSGRYAQAQLREWLRCFEGWLKGGARQVFVYFDNDQAGYAALNALELQNMIHP